MSRQSRRKRAFYRYAKKSRRSVYFQKNGTMLH